MLNPVINAMILFLCLSPSVMIWPCFPVLHAIHDIVLIYLSYIVAIVIYWWSQCAPRCAQTQMTLRCSATVGNLGEREEPDILTLVRHWDLLRALRTGRSTRDLHFNHESELHMSASARKRTPAAWTTGGHATIKPLKQTSLAVLLTQLDLIL